MTTTLDPLRTRTAPHIFLIGRPPLGEFIGYVASQVAPDENVDHGALAQEWRVANDHVRQLELAEVGVADGAGIQELPSHLADHTAGVMGSEMYRQSFSLTPWRVGLVELDRLVVHQKHINLAHVDRLKFTLGAEPDEQAVLTTCLPLDAELPSWNIARVAQNGFTFVSPSNDLRVLGIDVLQDQNSVRRDRYGRPVAVVAAYVGFSVNALSVIHVGDRLLLHNGSHRAYALRELGVTHAPAVVIEVSRPEELEVVAAPDVTEHLDRYLHEPRPSILRDYFDPRLRRLVNVSERSRVVRTAINFEMVDDPIG